MLSTAVASDSLAGTWGAEKRKQLQLTQNNSANNTNYTTTTRQTYNRDNYNLEVDKQKNKFSKFVSITRLQFDFMTLFLTLFIVSFPQRTLQQSGSQIIQYDNGNLEVDEDMAATFDDDRKFDNSMRRTSFSNVSGVLLKYFP